MDLTILKMDETTLERVNECNEPFLIDSQLVLHEHSGELSTSTVPVAAHQKSYPSEDKDYADYVKDPDMAVFLAFAEGELAGYIRLLKHWNAYGYVDDIAIKDRFRRRGVGRALILRAIEWARERGFPGLMLETQNNNVAACRLYESCGFRLGGFDRYLYRGLHPGTDEIALYWYFLFESS